MSGERGKYVIRGYDEDGAPLFQRWTHADSDCEKANHAALMDILILRFTPAMVSDGRALATIERALGRS